MSKVNPPDIRDLEQEALENLRRIAWDIDSPNLGVMYDAVGRLAALETSRLLLPKSLDLTKSSDRNVKQAAFTVAGKNAFGKYLSEFFSSLEAMNPAEREQVLQGVSEAFSNNGPTSPQEQKNWIDNLERLGREHQPAVFELMIHLGNHGKNWIMKQIQDNIKGISLGAVPTFSSFSGSDKKRVIGLLCRRAAKDRRDLIPYICGVVDRETQNNLQLFMRKSSWQERVEIAGAIASLGIQSASGLVMELVADSNWQVKQALLENLKIEDSKINPLLIVISHLLAESHTRVRAQAERTLLLMGNNACEGASIKEQRKKLEKKFRSQLLKAVQANKDLDTEWLGIESKKADPMVDIMQMVSFEDEGEESQIEKEQPEGVSLSDFSAQESSAKEEEITDEDKSILLSALLGAQKSAIKQEPEKKKSPGKLLLDPTIPATSRFILVMQKLAEEVGKNVPIDKLLGSCIEAGMSDEEFTKSLNELETQGIVYRPSAKTVRYVDTEL